MIVSFSELPSNSRIWIYPSSRKFYDSEISTLESKVATFFKDWVSEEVSVGSTLEYNRFLIFGIDTKETITTHDIDRLVSFIFQLQTEFEVELLDRMNVCFKQGEFVQYKDLKEFQKLIKQKAVSKKTIVFDNLLERKHEFDDYWEVPITESWYNRFF